jgi:phosphoglycerate kinase
MPPKKLLLKVDFNIPDVQHIQRIEAVISDIVQYCSEFDQVFLITHWDRPITHDPNFSTKRIIEPLNRLLFSYNLAATFWDQYANDFDTCTQHPLVLLENTRFEAAEQDNHTFRLSLAKKYAHLASNFIDDAFSASHRQEATNTELKCFTNWSYGILYQQETGLIQSFVGQLTHPFCAIVGGGKVATKLPLLQSLLPHVDNVLIGGRLCHPFLRLTRPELVLHTDIAKADVELCKELLDSYQDKIILPLDVRLYNDQAMDIGAQTELLYTQHIISAQKIFWNGPMGDYALSGFENGTRTIAKAMQLNSSAHKLSAGGDTLACVQDISIGPISYGGGASLALMVELFAQIDTL